MVATTLKRSAARSGSSAAADIPTGKPRLAPTPQQAAPTKATGVEPKTTSPQPRTAAANNTRSTATRP